MAKVKKALRNTVLIAAGAFSTGALALGPSAEPQCAQVICLSPAMGTAAPRIECPAIRQVYFDIRIFTPPPKFNPSATAEARHAFLRRCSTARMSDLQVIKNKYGRLFADPIVY